MSTSAQAMAGTLESNDILITIRAAGPGETPGVTVDSIVAKQFGGAILATITAVLADKALNGVCVHAQDKGALDCTIKARTETVIARYKGRVS